MSIGLHILIGMSSSHEKGSAYWPTFTLKALLAIRVWHYAFSPGVLNFSIIVGVIIKDSEQKKRRKPGSRPNIKQNLGKSLFCNNLLFVGNEIMRRDRS